WDNVEMTVINTTSANNILKFDDVVSIILNEEIQRKIIEESLSRNDLNVKIIGRKKERSKSKNNGKSNSRNGRSKSR
ncbi:hypothetical protein KI387_043122, partial [Taxus chinensis]